MRKMNNLGMDKRGQISAEYLLLLVVILTVISLVTYPLINKSVDATTDVSHASDASNAINSIANAANVVYANGPGAQRTLQVNIPVDMTVTLLNNGKTITTTIPLSGSATKTINATTDYPVAFSPSTTITKGNRHVVVSWAEGANSITIKVS